MAAARNRRSLIAQGIAAELANSGPIANGKADKTPWRNNGGRRPGSGRKRVASENYNVVFSREMRAMIFRFAKDHGIGQPVPGKSPAFLERVLREMFKFIPAPKEPEYLSLVKR